MSHLITTLVTQTPKEDTASDTVPNTETLVGEQFASLRDDTSHLIGTTPETYLASNFDVNTIGAQISQSQMLDSGVLTQIPYTAISNTKLESEIVDQSEKGGYKVLLEKDDQFVDCALKNSEKFHFDSNALTQRPSLTINTSRINTEILENKPSVKNNQPFHEPQIRKPEMLPKRKLRSSSKKVINHTSLDFLDVSFSNLQTISPKIGRDHGECLIFVYFLAPCCSHVTW